MHILYKIKFSLVLIFFTSCSNNTSEIIATVEQNELTYNDVEQILGEGIDRNSEEFQNYVKQWVINLVWVRKANEELNKEEKNFDKKIEEYRNTLLKYTLENKIISKFKDTIINQNEIENYYRNNLKDFELKENVILYRYLKVDKNNKNINELKNLIQYKNENQKNKFLDLIEQNKLYCVINEKQWTNIDDIKNLISLNINNEEHFLKGNKLNEVIDQNYVWIIYISDYILKNNTKPLAMVKDKIKKILIYKNQLKIIKDTETKYMNEAIDKGWANFN